MKNRFTIILLVCLVSFQAAALEWNIKGQASAWAMTDLKNLNNAGIGLRYLPEASVNQPLGKTNLDAVASLNLYGNYWFQAADASASARLYRGWGRFSTAHFEARIGLQKMDFGPAMLLRPLMWFDSIDPRDPLQLTNGVNSALLRYVFLNNANIWLWGVLSDGKTKGLEIFSSVENSIEYGGRIEYPTPAGEIAATFHHRRVNAKNLGGLPFFDIKPFDENRYAIDGKWDIGVGIWVEAALIRPQTVVMTLGDQKLITGGIDYTFGLGNGLHVLAEQMIIDVEVNPAFGERRRQYTGLLMDYSLSVWDQFFAIYFYNKATREIYQFYTWRRTYDHWAFHVSAFWNPDAPMLINLETAGNASFYQGRGIQILVVFNH
jgi:hypothetical protein